MRELNIPAENMVLINELIGEEKYKEILEDIEKQYDDIVKHPNHYCYSKYEPKDVIREWGLNFNLGSAVKYIARAGRKDDIIQDLSKAKQFIEFEIEYLENQRKNQ